MTYFEKVQNFAALVERETIARLTRDYNYPGVEAGGKVRVLPGRKYTKVDVGNSGKYIVEQDTEKIYGIKTYGVINRRRYYGTLDEVNQWHWGSYYGPCKKAKP
jgi:hypothetical protein